jgi:L-alanine-DL-glutamate epimerase-like enolase superfamily enzyme
MSHSVCRSVGGSILVQTLDGPADIARMSAQVAYDSMDLLQAAHTMSGVELALWDLLDRVRRELVWKLLGYKKSEAKVP